MSAIPFETDVAALAVFDPEVLRHRVRAPKGWWREGSLEALPEVADGRCVLLSIGREGSYRVRLAPDGLTAAEQARAVGAVAGVGLAVTSGELFVGAADRLPGAGFGDRISRIPGTGEVLEVAPGDYAVEVHVLAWRDDDACYDEDGEVRPDAPADFVVILRPRTDPVAVEALPDLLDLLPKVEAKGRAKVGNQPARRRSSPAPSRGRRRSAGAATAPASIRARRGPCRKRSPPTTPTRCGPRCVRSFTAGPSIRPRRSGWRRSPSRPTTAASSGTTSRSRCSARR